MGLSRDTFYRYKKAVERGGVAGLLEKDRRRPNLKSRTDEQTEAAVVEYADGRACQKFCVCEPY